MARDNTLTIAGILIIGIILIVEFGGLNMFSILDYRPGQDGSMEINLINEDAVSYTYDITYNFDSSLYSHDCGMFDGQEFSYSFSNVHQGAYNSPLPLDIQTDKYFTASDMDFGVISVTTNKCSGHEGHITTEAQNPFAECKITSLSCQPSSANQGNGCIRADCNYKLYVKASEPGQYIISASGKARVTFPKQGIECVLDEHCGAGKNCQNNVCKEPIVCKTDYDVNCNGIVDRNELGDAISKWLFNQINREELSNVIQAWAE